MVTSDKEHHRGIHRLINTSDKDIIARAKQKGLHLHPDIESSIDQGKKAKRSITIRRRGLLS